MIGSDTTRFHSFTDETIMLVCDSEFVGNVFTDDIPDRNRSSAFLSSVIPNSVAISVGKKSRRCVLSPSHELVDSGCQHQTVSIM